MCSTVAAQPKGSSQSVQRGLGLIDTLVALLLLALSLLGACTMLVRTLGASRAATLQSTAVDLATDFAEDLRSGPASMQGWQQRVATVLPVGSPPLDGYADATASTGLANGDVSALGVSVKWWDPAIHSPTNLALEFVDVNAAPAP